jgi:hypothetical protein
MTPIRSRFEMLRPATALVCFVTVCVLAAAARGQSEYPSPLLQPSGGGPRGVAVGDLNHDGWLDIVATAPRDGRILIHPGNGDGSFGALRNFVVGGEPVAVAVADFDRDGLSDVIFVDELKGQVGVLFQEQTFPVSYILQKIRGADEPGALLVADLDGDLYPEIVVAQGGADQIAVFHNEQGVLAQATVVEVGDDPFRLARMPQLGTSRILVLNRGFLSQNLLSVDLQADAIVGRLDFGSPADLLPFDVDGDGEVELEVLDSRTGTVQVLSTSDGSSFVGIDSWQAQVGSQVLKALDGAPGAGRYLVGDTARCSFSVYRDTGAQVVRERSWLGGQNIENLAMGDFDGDGARELVVPLTGQDVLQVSSPLGEGFLAHESLFTGRIPARILRRPTGQTTFSILCAGSHEILSYDLVDHELVWRDAVPVDPDAIRQGWVDFDGDGLEDLVVLVARMGVRIHHNNGAGFDPPFSLALDGELRDLLVYDAMGSSAPDLLVANRTLSAVVVFEGDGVGGFTAADTVHFDQPPARLRAHDLDLDGREDLVVLGDVSQVALTYRRDTGLSKATVFGICDEARDANFGNFNGDAYPDIVIANSAAGTFSILSSVFQGIYSPTTVGQSTPSGAANVMVFDIDNSGSDDLIFTSSSSEYASYHFNTGKTGIPAFSVPQRVRVGVLPLDAAPADLDGDGVEDFFVADGGGSTLNLVRSNPDVLLGAVDLRMSAQIASGRVALKIEGTAATSAEFQLRRASDGRRLVPSPLSRGVWTATDSLVNDATEDYLLYDREGRLLDKVRAEGSSGEESRVEWTIRPPRSVDGITEIEFRAPTGDAPEVRVLDLRGRRVARLQPISEGSGWHLVRWGGKDDRGMHVARGRYYVRIEAAGQARSVALGRVGP